MIEKYCVTREDFGGDCPDNWEGVAERMNLAIGEYLELIGGLDASGELTDWGREHLERMWARYRRDEAEMQDWETMRPEIGLRAENLLAHVWEHIAADPLTHNWEDGVYEYAEELLDRQLYWMLDAEDVLALRWQPRAEIMRRLLGGYGDWSEYCRDQIRNGLFGFGEDEQDQIRERLHLGDGDDAMAEQARAVGEAASIIADGIAGYVAYCLLYSDDDELY